MIDMFKPIGNLLDDLLSSLEDYEILTNNMLYEISSMILNFRIEKKMNQSVFAEFMDVSQAMVSKWESGEYNFSIEQLAKICCKINCTPQMIFSFDRVSIGTTVEFANSSEKVSQDIIGEISILGEVAA